MKTVRIVGGGLAGLTLGIALRQRAVPVELVEAGSYPRHRVCGEFVSGRGLETLKRLGLFDELAKSGRLATSAAFFTGERGGKVRPLPEPALCLSRFTMDVRLAEKFRELGGTLICGKRLGQAQEEGTVFATGRVARAKEQGWHWFGMKAHARGLKLSADLEMHFTRGGYIGLCQLPDGVVNACGLYRRRTGDSVETGILPERLANAAEGSLRKRLQAAEWEESSFCAVGGLSYAAGVSSPDECRIGDARAMIPPVTGNGMSLALESAELAIAPLVEWAQDRRHWRDVCGEIERSYNKAFSGRLLRARWLQRGLFNRMIGRWLMPVAEQSDGAWRLLFAATR